MTNTAPTPSEAAARVDELQPTAPIGMLKAMTEVWQLAPILARAVLASELERVAIAGACGFTHDDDPEAPKNLVDYVAETHRHALEETDRTIQALCATTWLKRAKKAEAERDTALAKSAKLSLKLDALNPTVGLDNVIDGMLERQEMLLGDVHGKLDMALERCEKLEAATQPRPMSEAPKDGKVLLVTEIQMFEPWCWEDNDGTPVDVDIAEGWLPTKK